MVYGFSHKSGSEPTWREMEHAVLRNFGGLDNVEPVKVFEDRLAGSINRNVPVSSSSGVLIKMTRLGTFSLTLLFSDKDKHTHKQHLNLLRVGF